MAVVTAEAPPRPVIIDIVTRDARLGLTVADFREQNYIVETNRFRHTAASRHQNLPLSKGRRSQDGMLPIRTGSIGLSDVDVNLSELPHCSGRLPVGALESASHALGIAEPRLVGDCVNR
jgi:hypothetical protein